jgi:aminopeptidase N
MNHAIRLAPALALTLVLGGCAAMGGPAQPQVAPVTPADLAAIYTGAGRLPQAPSTRDIHSHAQPDIARVVDISLLLDADFETQTLKGTARLMVVAAPGADRVVLDTRGLDINWITDAAGTRTLPYVLGANDPILGQSLTVQFDPATASDNLRGIVIAYSTRPDAAALQWLTPAQTAGGRQPYMFSQGQAILTRSWIPTQDSPGIRQTWNATIEAPQDLRVVMSGEMLSPEGEIAHPDQREAGRRSWRFREPNPVPPYLIAIGVGDLGFEAIDQRTGVWTEPSMLTAAHAEMVPTAEMVDAAEALYGPYRWGRYDLLILPPSFPFGGMENPRLTFATPTIIAGDRSLVSLVAHELAHSWSGNLVTNATWADFWLNEGFTVYFENRIMEAVYGRDRALMLQSLGWGDLQSTLAGLPAADTRLKLDLAGRDPDEGLTDVAYEKGAAFLHTIERTVGRERFDAWLKGYFERNAFRPMTTELFLEDIRTHLVTTRALEDQLMMDAWIYQPGMPSNWVPPVSGAFAPVDAGARAFFADSGPASAIPWAGWSTQERQRFLAWRAGGRAAGTDWLTPAQLADLEATLKLREEGNAELVFAWLQIAVQHRYQPAVPTLERFLTTMGRRKFVLPLFTSLWAEGDWGRAIATPLYARARPGYHPVTTNSVDAVVGRP